MAAFVKSCLASALVLAVAEAKLRILTPESLAKQFTGKITHIIPLLILFRRWLNLGELRKLWFYSLWTKNYGIDPL